MLSITPFLWFETQAEEAMRFYGSLFPRAQEVNVLRAGGQVVAVTWELEGQRITALNGSPKVPFTEAVSFAIGCDAQEEIDRFWAALTDGGGTPGQCGWLKDRFGVSWQVIPNALGGLLGHPDRERAGRALQAMLGMQKLDLAALQRAFDGA